MSIKYSVARRIDDEKKRNNEEGNKIMKATTSPTLFHNLGYVYKYLEKFSDAYNSFEICEKVGQGTPYAYSANREMKKIIDIVTKLDNCFMNATSDTQKEAWCKNLVAKLVAGSTVQSSGSSNNAMNSDSSSTTSNIEKNPHLGTFAECLASVENGLQLSNEEDSGDDVEMEDKPAGVDERIFNKRVVCKVLSMVTLGDPPPILLVAVDQMEKPFVISIHNCDSPQLAKKLCSDAVLRGARRNASLPGSMNITDLSVENIVLDVRQGRCRHLVFKKKKFPCLRVDHPGDVFVFGESLGKLALQSED